MEDYDDLIIQQINNIEPLEQNECFICFEIQKSEEFPIRLKNQTLFLKFCSCDGWIHDSCLKVWFNANEKCPICRKIMLVNENMDLEYGFYIIFYFYCFKSILIKICNKIIRFRNVLIFCVILANIINITSLSLNKYHKQNYNYDYNYEYNYDYNYEYNYEYTCYYPSECHYDEPIENRIVPID
jgi:hypothetical protein